MKNYREQEARTGSDPFPPTILQQKTEERENYHWDKNEMEPPEVALWCMTEHYTLYDVYTVYIPDRKHGLSAASSPYAWPIAFGLALVQKVSDTL